MKALCNPESLKPFPFFGILLLTLCLPVVGVGQNVGIGTDNPSRELSVNGSIIVDHDTLNHGSLYDPALLFGPSGLTGIMSDYHPLHDEYHGMSFWTDGYQRMTIKQNGYVGIGNPNPYFNLDVTGSIRSSSNILSNNITATNNLTANNYVYATGGVRIAGANFSNIYKLQVGGDSYFNGDGTFTGFLKSEGNLIVEGTASIYSNVGIIGNNYTAGDGRVLGNMAIGGNVDENYRLRVWDGNARIGGDFHATGNAAIGGAVDDNLRFRVYGGNSRFGGDVEITGTLNTGDLAVADNFTINGSGSVRSNGPSPLKISFESKSINAYVYGGSTLDQTVNLPAFDAVGDIRVVIAQFVPQAGDAGNYWDRMTFQAHEVNVAQNTCVISIQNPSPASWIKGTLYYMVILKDN